MLHKTVSRNKIKVIFPNYFYESNEVMNSKSHQEHSRQKKNISTEAKKEAFD